MVEEDYETKNRNRTIFNTAVYFQEENPKSCGSSQIVEYTVKFECLFSSMVGKN
jgi:hypothetical protein